MKTGTTPDLAALKALADERRLAIIELLGDGSERCACVLASELGMSDALVSHHLAKLRESGLVETRRDGRWVHVRLGPDALAALADGIASLAETARRCAATAGGACCGRDDGKDDVR